MVNSSHASLPKSEMIEKGAKLETESCTKMDSSKRDVTLCVCVCVCVNLKFYMLYTVLLLLLLKE
jgi:hypothetical protein